MLLFRYSVIFQQKKYLEVHESNSPLHKKFCKGVSENIFIYQVYCGKKYLRPYRTIQTSLLYPPKLTLFQMYFGKPAIHEETNNYVKLVVLSKKNLSVYCSTLKDIFLPKTTRLK